jgi:hypothetical protein
MKKFIFVFSLLLSNQCAFGMDEQKRAKEQLMIVLTAAGLGKSIDAIRQLQDIKPSDITGIGRKQEATCMKYRAVLANGDQILAKHFTQTNTSRCLREIKNSTNGLLYYIPLADNVINLLSATYDLNANPGT